MSELNTFGETIKAARKTAKQSLKAMAAELDISVHQLAAIEEGRKAVSLPLAKKIAEYFKARNASEES
ncbi:Predicted transcriptional regulator [Cardiobacterium hominis]|uniref:HTH cro/C1-type domain-containing protein n=1 Tax=Cardiobacterium hominis (strain ATCC 15826 / DSM 8339 / NCTC 10426 / 6573) TaxID=638300 RepID=C8N779_CARH6|nr:helix-turn-helix transcriptional regulator [Cardiobacterium hominis]EEV89575.1 hypothetical protein HMPREF0198_0356 [Cardiobacterium hominis ATCC 15826]VEG76978.1 Predicted transcriptional regulator [Cardiobacterium hominis]